MQEAALSVEFTGSAEDFELQILLPSNRSVRDTKLNGRMIETSSKRVEQSSYLVLPGTQGGVHRVEITFV
jgi:hypothetical protein